MARKDADPPRYRDPHRVSDRPDTWRIMILGEKVRITVTSEPEARAKAYRLQDEARARAERWPRIRERLKWPPDADALEAVEGEGRTAITVTVWRELVAKHLNLCEGDEWADLDYSRPHRIDLQALSEFEAFWRTRSKKIAVTAAHTLTAAGNRWSGPSRWA